MRWQEGHGLSERVGRHVAWGGTHACKPGCLSDVKALPISWDWHCCAAASRRGALLPDPRHDAVRAIVLAVADDDEEVPDGG